MTIKTFATITLSISLCCTSYALAQQPTQAESSCPQLNTQLDMKSCANDSRPEIKAFCKKLSQLQGYANQNPRPADSCFRSYLSNLALLADTQLPVNKALPSFIAASGVILAKKGAIADIQSTIEQRRPDQQFGPTANANGTTSLVSWPGSTELLSLAINSGIVTQSVNGATTTLSTNADQIFRLISNTDPDCTVTCKNSNWFESKILNYTNVSASFNVAQPSNTTAPTSGQASGTTPQPVSNATIPAGVGRLATITARYQLMNKFDPRGDKFKKSWHAQISSLTESATNVTDASEEVFTFLKTKAPWTTASQDQDDLKAELLEAAKRDASGAQLVSAFERSWARAVTTELLQDPTFLAAISKVMQDRTIYRQAWLKAVDNAVGTLLTFEYSFNRPVSQPETHDIKLIYAYNFQTTGMVTFNGAISLYSGALPAGANYGRIHYGQVSGQYDRMLTRQSKAMQMQFSLAGYWQYQPEPSVLNIPAGTVAPGTNSSSERNAGIRGNCRFTVGHTGKADSKEQRRGQYSDWSELVEQDRLAARQ